tara:strand:+ start:1094 stop:1351 length:258 start_codon:yes stop_codon:yes gene_type:complete
VIVLGKLVWVKWVYQWVCVNVLKMPILIIFFLFSSSFFFINTRYGTTSGTITLNGTKDRISNHRDIMGFVPQGKCFYKSLFVIKN